MEDSFFKKLESVDRFVVKRERSPLSSSDKMSGEKMAAEKLGAPNDGPEIWPLPSPPLSPPELSPTRPIDTRRLLGALIANSGLVTVGELARLVPGTEPQGLISGVLDARAKGLVAVVDGDEVIVSITDAGRAFLT